MRRDRLDGYERLDRSGCLEGSGREDDLIC
jgi:hypothetical protein